MWALLLAALISFSSLLNSKKKLKQDFKYKISKINVFPIKSCAPLTASNLTALLSLSFLPLFSLVSLSFLSLFSLRSLSFLCLFSLFSLSLFYLFSLSFLSLFSISFLSLLSLFFS
jgi:hypothetical protein